MAKFDFITDNNFQISLESDYQELNKAMESGSWKSVHVLAGSIIEAVLADYLLSINYQDPKGKDVLKMVMSELIAACKSENVLSQTAEDLSNVVREYRNLIHPGKIVREHQVVDAQRAKVAQALVEIIVDEITIKRAETYGYTAEQIVSRLESDPARIVLLERLLKKVGNYERKRLLLDVLPQRHYERTVAHSTMQSMSDPFFYDNIS